ncbi:MAG TPA: hypothetical protein VNJ31_00515 [Methyloceanibacter sp.]|nr:hypothetical protein [Methyloceanibacter sp.]
MNDKPASGATKPGSGFEFVIRRHFAAPLEHVWRTWTASRRFKALP